MKAYASTIFDKGGEGVMIRKPSSMYENGRSHSVLKYKVHNRARILLLLFEAFHANISCLFSVAFVGFYSAKDIHQINNFIILLNIYF